MTFYFKYKDTVLVNKIPTLNPNDHDQLVFVLV